MTNPDHTDSPLAHPRHRPPAPKNLEALTAVARSIDVPFAFSHSTAAEIAGWPTPWAARVVGDLHVITETRAGHLKRTGFIGHRGLESRAVVLRHGLPIVAPAHTWADLGELVGRGLPYTFEDKEAFDKLISAFEAKFPEIKVVQDISPSNDYQTQALNRLKGGAGRDRLDGEKQVQRRIFVAVM